jgi:hypothetical protein
MPEVFEAGRLSAARLLTSHVRNVTIEAESLVGFAFEPGAEVAIRLPRGDGGAVRAMPHWKTKSRSP